MAFQWYNPQSSYGQTRPGYDPFHTPFGLFQERQNPDAGYMRFLAERGLGGLDQKSRAAQGMYGKFAQGYGAAQTKNTDLEWRDYLKDVNFEEVFAQMTPQERGVNSGVAAQDKDRWALR